MARHLVESKKVVFHIFEIFNLGFPPTAQLLAFEFFKMLQRLHHHLLEVSGFQNLLRTKLAEVWSDDQLVLIFLKQVEIVYAWVSFAEFIEDHTHPKKDLDENWILIEEETEVLDSERLKVLWGRLSTTLRGSDIWISRILVLRLWILRQRRWYLRLGNDSR